MNLRWYRWIKNPFKIENEEGMTLIEIIIVVALLGTLMTYLISSITNTAENARKDQAKLGIGNIRNALNMYQIHNHKFPTTDAGLQALLENPDGNKKWRGPYIEKEKLMDPWNNEFEYESDGHKYKITSGGTDGEVGTDDDIVYPEKEAEGEGS
ncbi:MAG: type II secretion system major pseudopilin GspG [Bdellovibrionota bacterium]